MKDGGLDITIASNEDRPLQQGTIDILLAVNIWEYAYYRNAKTDYIQDYLGVVNWITVGKRLKMAGER